MPSALKEGKKNVLVQAIGAHPSSRAEGCPGCPGCALAPHSISSWGARTNQAGPTISSSWSCSSCSNPIPFPPTRPHHPHPHPSTIHPTPVRPPAAAGCLSLFFLPPDTFLHGPSAASLTEQAKPTPIPGPVPSLSSGIHSFTYLPRLISSDLSLFSAIFFSIPSYSLFNHPRPDSTKPTQS